MSSESSHSSSTSRNIIDRRRFLFSTAAVAALPSLHAFASAPGAPARLKVFPEKLGATVPANFVGLSYETQQLSDPTFFTAQNTGLIAQMRALTTNGVLRLGGNTSDVGWWKADASTQPPKINVRHSVGEPSADNAYFIQPEAVVNLKGFLDAVGWTCLYGINLGTNTPERAAEQAAFVAKTLGSKLQYFQLGNEPDLFKTHLRDPATWNADRYFDEWLAMANAIRAKVPNAKFGIPDTSGNPEWYAVIATRLLALKDRPYIAALSHHYYIGGPPSNPDMTLSKILHTAPKVHELATNIIAAAAKLSAGEHRTIPYRMTEGNTCYRGGKPGVSDTFGAALWAADLLLTLATMGYAGVNLHGGDGQMVANSLGGTLPGELLMADPKTPHPRPFYTPIAHMGDNYVAEPIFYGMKFAANFAGATMVKLDFDPGPVNATAFAGRMPNGQLAIAIVNKDDSRDLHIDLPGYSLGLTLTAPKLSSTSAELSEPAQFREASTIPHGSAAILYQAHA